MKILITVCALIASFALYGFTGVPGKPVSKKTNEKPTCVEQTKDDKSCFTSIEQYQAWQNCVKRTGSERKCYLSTINAPRPLTCVEKPLVKLVDCFDDKEKYLAWEDCANRTGYIRKCFDQIVTSRPDPDPTPDPEPSEPVLAEVEVPEFRGDGRDLGLDVTQALIYGENRHRAYAVTRDGALALLRETPSGWSSCRPIDGTNFIAGKISAVSWLELQSGALIWRQFLFANHPLGGLRIVRSDDSGDFDIFGPLDVSGQPNAIVRGSPSAVVIPSRIYTDRHEALVYIGSDQGLVEYTFVERSSGPFLPGHLIPLGNAGTFADPASFGNPVAISYLHQGDTYVRVFLIANTDGFPNGELLEARKRNPGLTNPPWQWIRHGSPDANRRFGSIAATQWVEPQQGPTVAIAGLADAGHGGSPRFYVAEGDHLDPIEWHDAGDFRANGSEPIMMSSVSGSGSNQQSHVIAMAVDDNYRLNHVVRFFGSYVQATQSILGADSTPVDIYGGVGASGTYVNGSWFALGRDSMNPYVDTFFVHRFGGGFESHIMNESLCP